MARGLPIAATVIEHAGKLPISGRRRGRFSETHENLDQVKVALPKVNRRSIPGSAFSIHATHRQKLCQGKMVPPLCQTIDIERLI
jgi:hypothetical protein